METIEEYFAFHSERLKGDFARIRKTHEDSDVKGGANEDVIAEFVEAHYESRFVATNADILDVHGQVTRELDVCVCNKHQPFGPAPGQPLIAEGVDFVIQVKAVLNTAEISRIAKNAESTKQVLRTPTKGTTTFGSFEDQEYFFNRIPYIVFAYTSSITLEKAYNELNSSLANTALEHQPDAVFVLDRGFLLNFREGKGSAWSAGEKKIKGWMIAHTETESLVQMMRFIYTTVPRFNYIAHPLSQYFSEKANFRVSGQVVEDAGDPTDS